MKKRLLGILLILCLFFGTCNYSPLFAYADTPVGGNMSDDDMVEAFKAYCKSRDLTIDGSLTDAVTKFTSQSYHDIVNLLGIDPTALQAEIQKIYDSDNVFQRYAFTALGINGFNRIFAQFLLDNDLEVGDTNVDKVVYSGKYITLDDGRTTLAWIVDVDPMSSRVSKSHILGYGTYLYDTDYLYSHKGAVGSYQHYPITLNGINFDSQYVYYQTGQNPAVNNGSYLTLDNAMYWTIYSPSTIVNGGLCIIYNPSMNLYVYGGIGLNWNWGNIDNTWVQMKGHQIYGFNNRVDDTEVTVVSPDIKPELPDDQPVYISPDGDVSDDPNGNHPVNPDPGPGNPGGTPPDWSLPDSNVTPDGDGGFNFDWNFTLPDLNIDWSIDGLINKFPFSIPHDVYLLCTTLQAEPVTPVIEGTIDLKVHQWVIDWDLHQFDNLASLLRSLEVLLFLIGLIMITRNIIKG